MGAGPESSRPPSPVLNPESPRLILAIDLKASANDPHNAMTQDAIDAPNTEMALTAAKKQLRAAMKQRLSAISSDSVDAQSMSQPVFLTFGSVLMIIGRKVFEALKRFKPYTDAVSVSVYLSMPAAEIQTDAIVRHALHSGKQVFIPYLHKSPLQTPDTPSRVMDMVLLKGLDDYEGLKRDKWGIPSVDAETVHERKRILGRPEVHHSESPSLDLMLLPGVAFDFDSTGGVRRLGHGRGFYDFFLNRYLARRGLHPDDDSSLQLWGLALTEQVLAANSGEEVPTGPQDRRLHGIIAGSGEVKESVGERRVT